MLKLRKVAVTGGLSCGKSSVCHLFKELGAYVVSADEIVHQIMSTNKTLGQNIINLLGADIVADGQLDRKKIAQKVFSNATLLKALENLLHPAVQDEIETHYQKAQHLHTPLFIAEIPLLFETGGESFFDATIVVTAPSETCRARFKTTTGYSDAEYDKRMERQWEISKKMDKADFIIVNNGSLDELKESVKTLFSTLTQDPKHKTF